MQYNPLNTTITNGDLSQRLTRKEAVLFEVLLENKNRVVSRDKLEQAGWADKGVGSNVADVYVGYIRSKLREVGLPGAIKTIRAVGYKLEVIK